MLTPYKLADNVTEIKPCKEAVVGVFCWKMTLLSYKNWTQTENAYDATGIQAYKIHWGCPHGGIYIVKG